MNSINISKQDELVQKSKFDFGNLKSDFFLAKIFGILSQKKSLEILKYNKNLQKRINISIIDYKKYCQTYSSIIIDLVFHDYIGRFINILNEEKDYFHFYLDDSNEEIKKIVCKCLVVVKRLVYKNLVKVKRLK